MTGIRQPEVGNPNMALHTGFILAEDEALKNYLEGMVVPRRPGSTEVDKVGVWFRFPEGERNIKYPFITIDLLEVAPAYDLWTSEYYQQSAGLYQPSVSPDSPEPDPWKNTVVRDFLAFRLIYQVAVHCRSSLHDRFLMSRFFTDVFPPRPFWLGVDADQTWRRTELLDSTHADLMETTESGNKRIFRKIYTVSMLAEIPQDVISQAWQVLRVYVPIHDRNSGDEMFLPEIPVADFDHAPSSMATATAVAANATVTHVP